MKYVKLFEGFKEEDIRAICKKYGIENYTINPDGSIDVNGRVDLHNRKLDKLPLKFNKIDGSFFIRTNKLTTLEGSPNYVDGYFSCRHNNLELLNDYDALRIEDERGICILSRLNGFLEDIGKPKLTDKQIKDIKEYYEIR